MFRQEDRKIRLHLEEDLECLKHACAEILDYINNYMQRNVYI